MKETVKMSRVAAYLEKITRALIARYYPDLEEIPIISIKKTPGAYAWVTAAKAWDVKGTTRHEIAINEAYLSRPIESLICSLSHELTHLWNMQHGIKDTSRGGQYHNKRFKEAAEARDLKISYEPRIGWSITEPIDALCEFILEQGWTDIQMNRIEYTYTPRGAGSGNSAGTAPTGNPNSHSIRYRCPCCGNICRSTKPIQVLCMDCNKQMLPQ